MRRWRGRCRERNLETNDRTDERELRSSGRTMISDHGDSAEMRAFISSAVLRLRAGITSLAPRLARILAVSAPMPDVAPVMIAVIWWRPGQVAVTVSAVDLDPKPLGPADPIRYLMVLSILNPLLFFFLYLMFRFCWYGVQFIFEEGRRLCWDANSHGLEKGAARFYI